MDGKIPSLKMVSPSKRKSDEARLHLEPIDRFKGTVLNLTESALTCLNRISQQEIQKDSPSPTLMEEYFLLHHCLDFIDKLCREKKDSSSQNLSEEYLLLHESMHFE